MVVIQATRDIRQEFQAVAAAALYEHVRTAVARGSGEPGEAPVQRGSVTLMAQELRATVASVDA
jgi:hypothetical protein